jgi:hypothetical protein
MHYYLFFPTRFFEVLTRHEFIAIFSQVVLRNPTKDYVG